MGFDLENIDALSGAMYMGANTSNEYALMIVQWGKRDVINIDITMSCVDPLVPHS